MKPAGEGGKHTGEFRSAKVFRDGEWRLVEFWQLKAGDLMMLFEPDGTPVYFKGTAIMEARSDPYKTEAGTWTIAVGVIGHKNAMADKRRERR